MARKMTPDRLIAELQAHVAEIAVEAQRGDYDARQWLCESFAGHVSFFHALWTGVHNEPIKRRPAARDRK